MGDNGGGNGQADQKEDGRWRCPYCKASGPCKKGDEKFALGIHLLACDVKWEQDRKKKKK